MPNSFSISIHTVLKNLIEAKSKRDKIKFTSYQLASALSMPRSIITKLTHSDESKRIINPRIETLIKIVEFFRKDGFDISLEDLIGINATTINIRDQNIDPLRETSISIYSLDFKKNHKIGSINLKINSNIKNAFGLYADKNIEPFFKIGSIFIIDPDAPLENDNLIALKTSNSDSIQIRKYLLEKNRVILRSLNQAENDVILMPTTKCEVLGVVVQVNAKT